MEKCNLYSTQNLEVIISTNLSKLRQIIQKYGNDRNHLFKSIADSVKDSFGDYVEHISDIINTISEMCINDDYYSGIFDIETKEDAEREETNISNILQNIFNESQNDDPNYALNNDKPQNIETVSSVYDSEMNMQFLDYAFKGMNILRNRFETQFRRLIWEACIVNRGSLKNDFGYQVKNTGLVSDTTTLNENIRDLQESQYGILVDYLNLDNKKMFTEEGKPRYSFLKNYKNIKQFFDSKTTDDILKAFHHAANSNDTQAQEDRKFIQAYNAYVLLSNFDAYIKSLFGKDIEIISDEKAKYKSWNKYSLADKSHTNRSNHAETEEIITDTLINYIVKGGIESTPEYRYTFEETTANKKDGVYLEYSDFANIISDVKTLANNPNAFLDLINFPNAANAISSLSQEAQDYLNEYKTLHSCIGHIKLDPANNIRIVLEILLNPQLHKIQKMRDLMSLFDQIKLDKMYSIYRGIFSSNHSHDSIYNIDQQNAFFNSFSQNAVTIYKNAILQYYTDRYGNTKVRYLYNSDLENLQTRIETSINSAHTIFDDDITLGIISKPKVENKQVKNGATSFDITEFKYQIPINSSTRIVVTYNTQNKKPLFSFEESGTLKINNLDANNFIRVLYSKIGNGEISANANAVNNTLLKFVTKETGIQFLQKPQLIDLYRSIINENIRSGETPINTMSDLFSFAANIRTCAIIRQEIFRGKYKYEDLIKLIDKFFGEQLTFASRNNVSLIRESQVPILKRIAQAQFLLNNKNTASIVKSGTGAGYSPYSLSRLLGGIYEQIAIQCENPDSAVAQSSFIKQPGFFVGVTRNLEMYSYSGIQKDVKKFNTAEFCYSGFLYSYIHGLIKHDNSKDTFGNGVIGILPTTNSDKSEISTAIFNLQAFKLSNSLKQELQNKGINIFQNSLYDVIVDQNLKPEIKSAVLHQIISDEIGTQYKIVHQNLENDIKKIIGVVNTYLETKGINYSIIHNDNISYSLTDLKDIQNQFNKLKSRYSKNLAQLSIFTCEDLIREAILHYNTSSGYGRKNPIVIHEGVTCDFDKNGNIKGNETFQAIIARFCPEFYMRKTGENIPEKFVSQEDFFKIRNAKTVFDLINDGFKLNIGQAYIDGHQTATAQKIQKTIEDTIFLKRQLDQIEQNGGGKWYSKSGDLVIAKIQNDNGELIDICRKSDLYTAGFNESDFRTWDQFIKNYQGKLQLNPLLEQYNLIDYIGSSEYTHATVGSIISHPDKGQIIKAGTDEKMQVLARESFRYLAQTKRNTSLTAAMESYQLGQKDGIPTRMRMAIIKDLKANRFNNLGNVDTVKVYDGAIFANPFTVYHENNSLNSARVGMTKKPYAHFYDERLMCAGNIKAASFPITNETIRSQGQHRIFMKQCTDLKWISENGSYGVYDITKTYLGDSYQSIVGNQYVKIQNDQNIKDGFYQIELIKEEGNNSYIKKLIEVDRYGRVVSGGKTEIIKHQIIDSNYKLWKAFGGENSCSLSNDGILVYSENSVQAVAKLANEVGDVKDSLKSEDDIYDYVKIKIGNQVKFLYQPLKHSDINYIATEGAIKMFQGNINPVSKYSGGDLNFVTFFAFQYGIQLDKEHNADQSELSMMTQVMNACAFRGFTFNIAKNLFQALQSLNRLGVSDFMEPFDKMFYGETLKDKEDGAKEFADVINKHLIDTLSQRSGSADRAKQFAQEQKILEKAAKELGKEFELSDIPYSDKAFYKQAMSSIRNILTKCGIKHKMDGNLCVMTPSHGNIKVYAENMLLSDFSNFETEISAMQNLIGPAFKLANSTNIDIKPIMHRIDTESNNPVYAFGYRYSLNENDSIDIVYDPDAKSYDIIFSNNLKPNTKNVESLIQSVVNSIPMGGDIRFGANNTNEKSQELYDMFRQYGFYDIVNNTSEYTNQDGEQTIIPTLRRNGAIDESAIVQQQNEQLANSIEDHIESREEISDVVDNTITILLVKNENKGYIRKLIKKYKDSTTTKIIPIVYTDTDLQSTNFANQISEQIIQADKSLDVSQTRTINFLCDDITKVRNKFIQQSHFNSLMYNVVEQIKNGLSDKTLTITSDGQSGFDEAAIRAARRLDLNWKLQLSKASYKTREFVTDLRTADERWTNNVSILPPGTKVINIDSNNDFTYARSSEARFGAGTFLPDNIFQKMYEAIREKQNKKIEEWKKIQNETDKEIKKKLEDEYEAKYKSLDLHLFTQDISGRTIESLIKQWNNLFDQVPDFDEFVLPLYKLWAYQHPSAILNFKRKSSDGILYSDRMYNNGEWSDARALAEVLTNISFAYDEDTAHLVTPDGMPKAISYATKFIGVDGASSDSGKIIKQQNAEIVNPGMYNANDLVLVYDGTKTAKNLPVVVSQINEALDSEAIIITLDSDPAKTYKVIKNVKDQSEKNIFGNVTVQEAIIGNTPVHVIARDKKSIDAFFITQEYVDNKSKTIKNIPQLSPLAYNLQQINQRIKLAEHDTKNIYDIQTILSKAKTLKNIDRNILTNEPILYSVQIDPRTNTYCFGQAVKVDQIQILYDAKNALEKIAFSGDVESLSLDADKLASIDTKLFDQYNDLIQAKDIKTKRKAYKLLYNNIVKAINKMRKKGSGIVFFTELQQGTTFEKGNYIDPDVVVVYTNYDSSRTGYAQRIEDDIQISENIDEETGAIRADGIEYTNIQSDIIRQATKYIDESIGNTDSKTKAILIKGEAGTGKTTIANTILSKVNKETASNIHVATSALSYGSRIVLDNSISPSIKNGAYKTYKSYSFTQLLGISLDENGRYDFSKIPSNAPIKNIDLLVLDDASMLNNEDFESLKSVMRNGSVILLLGDEGSLVQTKKVEGIINNNETVFNNSSAIEKTFELTESVKYGEQNPILQIAKGYYYPEHKTALIAPISAQQEQIADNGAVIYTKESTGEQISSLLQQAIDSHDPLLFKTLAFTNQAVDKYNLAIHQAMAGQDAKYYIEGEFVSAKSNIVSIDNSMDGYIVKAEVPRELEFKVKEKGIENTYKLIVQNLTVKFINGETRDIVVVPELQFNIGNKASDKQARENIKQLVFKYNKTQRNDKISEIGLSYATTIYRAQGNSYKVVQILANDILDNRACDDQQKQRLMYTAITRAKNVVLINSSNANTVSIQNLNELNNQIENNKLHERYASSYTVKGLEGYESKNGIISVNFGIQDGPQRFDFRKGDILYDSNGITYQIVEEPFVYSSIGDGQHNISEYFDNAQELTPGDIIVLAKPTNTDNVKEAAEKRMRERRAELGFDDTKVRKSTKLFDTSKITIGKTYTIETNMWKYSDSVNSFGDLKIVRNHGDASRGSVYIDDKTIYLNTSKIQEAFEHAQTNVETDQQKIKLQKLFKNDINLYTEFLIYKALFNKNQLNANDSEAEKFAIDKIKLAHPGNVLIDGKGYIDLVNRINAGEIKSVKEVLAIGRDLATIDYQFKDIDGNSFQLMDIDSIRELFELRDIYKRFGKDAEKLNACEDLKNLAKRALSRNYQDITPENFVEKGREIEHLMRQKHQQDLNNLSRNSVDLLQQFDEMIKLHANNASHYQYIKYWINYVLGIRGSELVINGNKVELTPDNFDSTMQILREEIAKTTKIKIHGEYRTINKGTVKCNPYEVIMPRVFATVFGLKKGDSLSSITSSYEADSFKTEQPSANISYLGFFGKRLHEQLKIKIVPDIYDYCLSRVTGDHIYIINKENFDAVKDYFTKVKIKTRTNVYGERILLDSNGDDVYQIGKSDNIYKTDSGVKVIVVEDPNLYLTEMDYSYIQLGRRILPVDENGNGKPSDKFNEFIESLSSIAETNENAKHIYKDLIKQSSENEQINNEKAAKYFVDQTPDSIPMLERLRNDGLRMYATFKTALDIVASRIPAQCQHSFMPMRIVGFVDSDVNNAYVSADQIWLQGSDYDIDTVSLVTFSIGNGGKLHLWSPYANMSTYETIQESLRLPFPTNKEYRISKNQNQQDTNSVIYIQPSNTSELQNWLHKYINRPNLFKPGNKKTGLFVISDDANIDDVISLLNDTPVVVSELSDTDANLIIEQLKNNGIISKNYQINPKDFASKLNDSILRIYNRHNLYCQKKSQKVQRMISNNMSAASMILTSKDPANMIESRTPIDSCKDEWTNIAVWSQHNDIEARSPGSYVTKAKGIVENQVGKDCISIAAVGLKALSAIQYYFNKVLNSGDWKKQSTLFFNKTIHGENYQLPIDIRALTPNSLSEKMLYALLYADKTNDPALAFSALLSLSVDNAKDLSLAKLNANPATMGMYLYGLTIGANVDTLTKILMGPIGDLCIELLNTNIFTSIDGANSSISQVLSYLNKGPFYNLQQKYSSKAINGEVTKKSISVFEAFLELFNSTLDGKNQVDVTDTERIQKLQNKLQRKMSSQNREDFINNTLVKIAEKIGEGKAQLSDFDAQLYQMLEDLKDYARYQEVIKNNQNDFEDFETLFGGAQEMKILGQILGLNQGLKSSDIDNDTFVSTLQNVISDDKPIDLEKFVMDKQYRDDCIKSYESKKHSFNILAIISEKEDVFGFLRDQVMAMRANNFSGRYRFGLNNYQTVKKEFGLKGRNSDIIEGLRRFYDDKILDDFIANAGINIHLQQGSPIVSKDNKISTVQNEDGITITLGNNQTNASFKYWFEQILIPFLKSNPQTAGNKFVQDLAPIESNKTVSRNTIYYYSIPTINLSPRESSDINIFQDYVSEFQKLGSIMVDGMSVVDLFAYYNIIAQRRNLGETTFTKLVDSAEVGVIKALTKYIAQQDKLQQDPQQQYMVKGPGSTINIHDILPYVVPMYGPKTLYSKYVRKRNPFTGQYAILRRKQQIKYSEEYDDDTRQVMEEEVAQYTPWYGSNYSLVSTGDTAVSQTGIISNVETRTISYNGNAYRVSFLKETDSSGIHMITSVFLNGLNRRADIPYMAISFDPNNNPTFFGKVTNIQSGITSQSIVIDTSDSSKMQRIKFKDKIAITVDGKETNVSTINLKFSEDFKKLHELTFWFNDEEVKLTSEDLDGSIPVKENQDIKQLEINHDIIRSIIQQKINEKNCQ